MLEAADASDEAREEYDAVISKIERGKMLSCCVLRLSAMLSMRNEEISWVTFCCERDESADPCLRDFAGKLVDAKV